MMIMLRIRKRTESIKNIVRNSAYEGIKGQEGNEGKNALKMNFSVGVSM